VTRWDGARQAALKILILKPSSLGDVVQALPVLRMLRRALPASKLFWWIDAELSPLLEGDPDLTGLFLFHRRRWSSPRYWHEAVASIRHMRAERFDWVIDLQALARSGLLAWLARGGFTIGLDDAREGAAALYDVCVRRPAPNCHAVDWYLEVLRALEVPLSWDFDWLPARASVAENLQRRWQPEGHRWIAIHPGARWLNKRWPVEHYAELVGRLAAAWPDLRFVVLGGASEAALAQAIVQEQPDRCLNLAGQTTLLEMVEWIRLSAMLIANDSAPMHVGAALRKPVVAIFGPTDPRRTGPYGQVEEAIQASLPCIPCLKSWCLYPRPIECLRMITPNQVFAAAIGRIPVQGSRAIARRSAAKGPSWPEASAQFLAPRAA
jgi:lipopolysaccharide heptosyltransferase II